MSVMVTVVVVVIIVVIVVAFIVVVVMMMMVFVVVTVVVVIVIVVAMAMGVSISAKHPRSVMAFHDTEDQVTLAGCVLIVPFVAGVILANPYRVALDSVGSRHFPAAFSSA